MQKYQLKVPVQWGSETVSELTVGALKAKHMRSVPAEPKMGDLLILVGHVTGQPQAFIDELDAADAMALCGLVGGFLSGGQGTGASA